ncbi:hypothetical protein MNB_SUP05-SYMBIONT-4-1365 [hydrothermal vent metagenome]|uniref:Uncharacterized protein n=1 Tax=hydrothermal vent metagenome TaxID=652676 RepID=A0A1W1E6F6_9ZZZZ
MKHIKQHLSHPKTRQITGYSPYFWVENALFSIFPKSHWVINTEVSTGANN